jgi:redox-sensing transcriptional repressor
MTSMNADKIPDIIIGRLPVYLRALQRLADKGISTTSSQELGEIVGISAAQIRKDISQFGEFGKQGTGYAISFLIEKLQDILKVDRVWEVVVVGMGDIGHALANYPGFANRGFHVKMVFDNDPKKVGEKIGEFEVYDTASLAEKIKQHKIKIAMIAVPAGDAQTVTDQLVKAGVKAILNYAPISLTVPEGVRVQYIDPVTHLQRMTYYL